MTAGWHVSMLGRFSVTFGHETVTRFQTRKVAALLARLAYYPQRAHPREELADLLWPDSDLPSAKNSLKQALASLRRQVETPGSSNVLIEADRADIRVRAGALTTDVAEFDRQVAQGMRSRDGEARLKALAAAMALYSGELLPGHYDEWIIEERERLAEAHLATIEELARLHEERGDPGAAVEILGRLLAEDPYREDACARLTRCHLAMGHPGAARRAHDALAERLREIGEEPPAELSRLVAAMAKMERVPSGEASRGPDGVAAPAGSPHSARDDVGSGVYHGLSHRLPAPLTRFIGRETELGRVLGMTRPGTERRRLVTLTGPGGVGKSRLALECAARTDPAFEGRVWFADLSGVADPEQVPISVAHSMEIEPGPARTVLQRIGAAASPGGLLVLDTLEHLLAPRGDASAVATVLALLSIEPNLGILVTSRRRLDVPGETELALDPLPVPDENGGDPEHLLRCPSVDLFVDRSRLARPDFQLTERNADSVARLCARLEGIPLALEIAAARAQVMSPRRMLEHLETHLALPPSHRRADAPRHASLEAAIASSVALLPADMARFFCRLSVFRGGWTTEAAAAVCLAEYPVEAASTPTPQDMAAARMALQGLRESSLIAVREAGYELRYHMLETVRGYAEGRVQDTGECATLSDRHLLRYVAWSEGIAPRTLGPDQAEALDECAVEADNVRAAIAWGCSAPNDAPTATGIPNDQPRPYLALRIGLAMQRYYMVRSGGAEGRRHLEAALALCSTHMPLVPRARNAVGLLAVEDELYEEAVRQYGMATDEFRRRGDERQVHAVLSNLGYVYDCMGRLSEARSALEEALAGLRRDGDRHRIGAAASQLGVLMNELGDTEASLTLLDEALRLFEETGDLDYQAAALANIGCTYADACRFAEAADCFERSVGLLRETRAESSLAQDLSSLASMRHALGQTDLAQRLAEESLRLARKVGPPSHVVGALDELATIYLDTGRPHEAIAAVSEAVRVAFASEDPYYRTEAIRTMAEIAAPIAPDVSARLLFAAVAARERLNIRCGPAFRSERDALAAKLRACIGDQALTESRSAGAAMSIEEAAQLALDAAWRKRYSQKPL